ncbi:hypothetical protein IWQ61_001223 [Dispira simplex]|nr:hypothetical protein IWQ61_001223 [Dispira simplex]
MSASPNDPGQSHRPYASSNSNSEFLFSPEAAAQLNPLSGIYGSQGLSATGFPGSEALYDNNQAYTALFQDGDVVRYDDRGTTAARSLLSFAGLRYATVAMSNPFEVGQTLLQVRYLPAGGELTHVRDTMEDTSRPTDDEGTQDIPGPEDPGYYEYLRSHPPPTTGTAPSYYSSPGRRQRGLRSDHTGYLVPTPTPATQDHDGTRDPCQLAVLEAGIWGTMLCVFNKDGEGLFSLFKGQLTGWLVEMGQLMIQPTLEGALNDLCNLYDDTIPLVYLEHFLPNLGTLVASHALTGWLLSPLELLRTRLMIQSSLPQYRKYTSVFSGLRTVLREEGGLSALYFSGVHLIPTVVFHSLRALFENTSALVIARVFGISTADAPLSYALAEFAIRTVELLVMLPIDTIRKRLQAQPRYTKAFQLSVTSQSAPHAGSRSRRGVASGIASTGTLTTLGFRPFHPLVNLSPIPYTGMLNCAYRVLSEEGISPTKARQMARRSRNYGGDQRSQDPLQESDISTNRIQQRRRGGPSTPLSSTWGLRGLYQGLGLHLTSHAALFAVSLLTGIEVEDDW